MFSIRTYQQQYLHSLPLSQSSSDEEKNLAGAERPLISPETSGSQKAPWSPSHTGSRMLKLPSFHSHHHYARPSEQKGLFLLVWLCLGTTVYGYFLLKCVPLERILWQHGRHFFRSLSGLSWLVIIQSIPFLIIWAVQRMWRAYLRNDCNVAVRISTVPNVIVLSNLMVVMMIKVFSHPDTKS